MFESLIFIFGFLFGATVMWSYVQKVHNLIDKLDLIHKDLAITLGEWRKTLFRSS